MRGTAALLLVLACLAVPAPAPAGSPPVERHWKLAQAYLKRGWRNQAVAEARAVLRLEPAHAGAKALVESGGVDALGLTSTPDGVSATLAEADRADLVSEAWNAYRESRLIDAHRLAAEVLAENSANAEAAEILRRLEEEEWTPSPLGANDVLREMYEQGMALYRRGEWEAATEVFRRALATEPSHGQLRTFHARARKNADAQAVKGGLERAEIALEAGDPDLAREELVPVLALEPNNVRARELMAKSGGGPLPIERKEAAKEHFNLGVAAYEKGDWEAAIREWELTVSLDRNDMEAEHLLRKARGKRTAARRESAKRISQLHEQALKLYQQGKAEEAGRLYRAILEMDPTDARARANLAVIESGGRK